MEQIYNRLKNGETSEDIAAEFTKALNEAQARMAKEAALKAEADARAALEKAEREAKATARTNEMVALINEGLGFCAKWYPELFTDGSDWDDADIKPIAELILLLLDTEAMKYNKLPKVKVEVKTVPKSKETAAKTRDNTDAFAEFFKAFGL